MFSQNSTPLLCQNVQPELKEIVHLKQLFTHPQGVYDFLLSDENNVLALPSSLVTGLKQKLDNEWVLIFNNPIKCIHLSYKVLHLNTGCNKIQFNIELLFQLRELVIKYLIWLD